MPNQNRFWGLAFSIALFLIPITSDASSWWNDSDYVHGISQRPIMDLVVGLSNGKVLFIDTREPEEYREGHIPGAINSRLADIDDLDVEDLSKYEYIVPYCLKDFRGFEVARALKEKRGLHNVVMMNPSGLAGWKSQNLPTIRSRENVSAQLKQWIGSKLTAQKDASYEQAE